MQTFKPFDHYVCVGDTRRVDVGPLTIVATIHADNDSTPFDFDVDCHDEWERGEWFYCGVVLSVYCGYTRLEDNAAALWGVEANYPGSDHSYLTDVANELIDEAAREGYAILQRLQSAVAA